MADEKDEALKPETEYELEVALGQDLGDVEVVSAERAAENGASAITSPSPFGNAESMVEDVSTAATAAHEAVHHTASEVNADMQDAERSAREGAGQAAAAANTTVQLMAQPSSTVANGQYQQAVQSDEETVAADAVAAEDEQREYEIERAADQEAEALAAQRESQAAEEERQREEQEAREREAREREEREREEREREEQEREEREREEAERAEDAQSDSYDY